MHQRSRRKLLKARKLQAALVAGLLPLLLFVFFLFYGLKVVRLLVTE